MWRSPPPYLITGNGDTFIIPHFSCQDGSNIIKLFAPLERLATITVIILVAALVISVFMKLGDAAVLTAYYCNTCEIVPTLFVAPQ